MAAARSENGFTLVEVLVALAVTALLLTAVYQTVSSAASARQQLAVENGRHHAARIVFERIGRELQSLHFVATDARTRFTGGDDQELLSFTSTASTPLAKEPGLPARISYRLEKTPEAKVSTDRLYRTESAALTIDTGRAYRMADDVGFLEIRFLAKGQWTDRWDSSTEQTLPDAVALTLAIGQEDDREIFRTAWQIGDR